eukprot:2839319-Pyramimonas_sp.AAC.1
MVVWLQNTFLPWMESDAREDLANRGAPYVDPAGLLSLSAKQKAHLGEWRRASDLAAKANVSPRICPLPSPDWSASTAHAPCPHPALERQVARARHGHTASCPCRALRHPIPSITDNPAVRIEKRAAPEILDRWIVVKS